MKDKYEQLMCDVHSLESEKLALAKELDQAQVDPTKGCSTAIKKKLKQVEENLARARSESRKHQQMYRQAEQEVQKCKVLERKIQELKHGKVNLIKKQKDAAAKHKEFTIQKTREIHALKRKERTADKKISEMESEVHKYKSNLERSRSQCEKLSDKLKQTETHLMRLLTKRRTDISHNARSSRQSKVSSNPLQRDLEGMEHFAPVNEEMNSLKFLLEKTVADRVSYMQTKESYTAKVIEHGELMQLLAKEAKVINTWKREYNNTDPNTSVVEDVLFEIKEHEDTVQQLQLKLEIVENDLDQLKSKFPSVEEDASEEDSRIGNGSALKMIAKLDGPVLRTLLWTLLDSYFTSELQRRNAKDTLLRKDSTLRSFENEIMMQNEKIDALTKSLERRKKLMSSDDNESDPFEIIHSLEEEVSIANKKLKACLVEKASVLTELEKTRDTLSMEEERHAKVEEQLALLRSQQKLTESTDETAQMLRQLQEVMAAIGMSREERDSVRMKLEHCVEDACARMLDDAKTQRDRKGQKVDSLRTRLVQMHDVLGIELQLPSSYNSLSNELATLESKLRKIQPQFDAAVERRARLLNEITNLASDFGETNLSDNLIQLAQQKSTGGPKRARSHSITAQQRVSMASSREGRAKLLQNVEAMISGLEMINGEATAGDSTSASELDSMKSGSLSEAFLDDCEREIKKMKHVRSDRLLSNVEKCDHLRSMSKQMHVGRNDLPSIVAYGIRKRKQGVPSWWDERMPEIVYCALFRQGSILVNESFTLHLTLMLQTLQAVSHGRQLLSSALRTVIDESHGALLATAEGCGMVNAEDLSRSLQEALQHLPPLSKEHSQACIDEMQMLNEAAEAVAQSEVETLTVLWEGLNVSSNQRGRFWGELEDSTTKLLIKTAGPFDHIRRECPPEVEEWVLNSISEATKVQKSLRIRVMKLRRIQEEVERLKKKQDAKNGIMSLNSELNVLNAKLVDFEEKAGDKQRLLNKKANSSLLLEEERYRKQMQAMFVSKLEALRQQLAVWEENEGQIDDADMLSEVVKSMLENSHRIDAWMNEKTRLMHLRTTKTSRLRENMIAERSASAGSRPGSISTTRSKGSPTKSQAMFNQRSRPTRSTSSTSDKYSPKSYKKSPSDSTSSSSAGDRKPKRNEPLFSSSLNLQEQSRDVTPKKPLHVNISSEKAPVLLPFGDLLADTPSKEKENY
jgi:outer membrane murein-binding lipoprotein Lpp